MELKPCPFCGGDKFAFGEQVVFCMKCHVTVALPYVMNKDFEYQDPKDTWNTRSERTCKNIHAQKVTLDCFRCSECGAATGWTRVDIDNVLFPLRYCPNCGAKIEKESWWSE